MTDSRNQAFYQLHEVTALLSEDMRVSMARENLTPARANLLWLLAAEPSNQRALAEAMGVSARNVTGLVDGLVASGHVERTAHPTDRRAHLVALTSLGRQAVATMVDGEAEAVDLLFSGLDDGRVADLVASLDVVLAALREHAIRAEPGEQIDG